MQTMDIYICSNSIKKNMPHTSNSELWGTPGREVKWASGGDNRILHVFSMFAFLAKDMCTHTHTERYALGDA